MDPILVPFWVVSGIAAAMIGTSITLAKKIRSLKKSKFVEKDQENKITDLSSRTSVLKRDLSETKKEFEKTQKQLSEFKDIDAREHAEINALKKSLEAAVKERDRVVKESEAQKQDIAHQEKELEKAGAQRVKLESDLKGLQGANKGMADKINKLELSVAELSKVKAGRLETLSRQKQELEQLHSQLSEVKLALQVKEKDLNKIDNSNRGMATKIQELEVQVKGLSHVNEADKKTISIQQKELKQAATWSVELNNTVAGKDRQINKFKDENKAMVAKIKELEAQVKNFNQAKEADQKTIVTQQKELKQAVTRSTELSNTVAEKEKQFHKASDDNKAIAEEIKELESRLKVSREDNTSSQQVITRQEQELERALKQNSELQDALGEKKKEIIKLGDNNRQMAEKIQELESSVAELNEVKEERSETISGQKQELEGAISQNSQLQSAVKEKEQRIQRLEEADHKLRDKLNENQSVIEGLKKEVQAQAIIIADLKGEKEEKEQAAPESVIIESKDEPAEIRDKNAAQLPELLSSERLVDKSRMKKALKAQEKYKGSLVRILFINRDVDGRKLADCISSKLSVPYLPLGDYRISRQLISLIPSEIAEEHWLVPVEKDLDKIIVAMVDPFDNEAIQKIEGSTGCKAQPYIGLFSEIAGKIQSLYQVNVHGLDAEGNLASPIFIDTAEYKGRERRRADRLKTEIAVRAADDERAVSSITSDVCWDGLSFKSSQEFPVYANVTVQLTLAESAEDQEAQLVVPAVAEVIRATPSQENNFMVGIKLTKILHGDLARIIKRAYREKIRSES